MRPSSAVRRSASVDTGGVGISPATVHAVEPVGVPAGGDRHAVGTAQVVVEGGRLLIDDLGSLVRLVVRADEGDTYSSEPGAVLGELEAIGEAVVVDRSAVDELIELPLAFVDPDGFPQDVEAYGEIYTSKPLPVLQF